MDFKIGDRIQVKSDIFDPDVPEFPIGDLYGRIDDIDDDCYGIILEVEYPDWVIKELESQGIAWDSCVYLSEKEIVLVAIVE